MSFTTNKASLLEVTHAVTVLLVLMDEGPMIKSVLSQKITTNNQSIQKRIKELVDNGLISETVEDEHPYRHRIELTPRGHAVAEHLAAIEEILRESP